MARLEKRILYLGRPAAVACDGNCGKAWGNNSRPTEQLSLNPDDYALLADGELGDAPADPGTYEGDHAKPIGAKSPDDLNKWCVRECERLVMSRYDAPADPALLKLPDFSRRVFNMRRRQREADIVAIAEKVGEHWRAQEGVNAALLAELAEVTKP